MFRLSKICRDGSDGMDFYYDSSKGLVVETDAERAVREAREAAEAEAARLAAEKAANNEKYGTDQTLKGLQDTFLLRTSQGVQFQKSASDVARDLISGATATVSMLKSNQNMDLSTQAAAGNISNASVDQSLNYRNTMQSVANQQSQNIQNTALTRAQEIANARNVVAQTGSDIQNLGLTNFGNQLKLRNGVEQQYSQELANAKAANRAAKAASDAAGLGLLGAAGASILCDERAKIHIKELGVFDNGLKYYEYYYLPELVYKHPLATPGRHTGLMAQEVEKLYPEAVKELDGYKYINYELLKEIW